MKRTAGLPRPAPLLLLAALSIAVLVPAARAATTDWVGSMGGRVRIVSMPPGPDGVVRAAVDIDLKPGWTTYWRNPGESGIPPQLSTKGSRNVASAELAFPAPVTLDEGGLTAIGYDRPVALPLTIRQARPGADSLLAAKLFIGVCKDICIPVSADFSLRIAGGPAQPKSSVELVTVAEAYASLPKPPGDAFAVRSVSLDGDGSGLAVTVRLPEGGAAGAPPQLFVAGPAGWSLAPARLTARSGTEATFSVPVTTKPETPAGAPSFDLVVRDGPDSIETTKTLQ